MPAPGFSDINSTGWVARLPDRLRPFALLARMDRPIGTWLLLLPGIWGILIARQPFGPSARLIALFTVGSFVMRGAGCVVNDMWDRDLDRQVARTSGRPLASGAISMPAAVIFLALLCLAGLLVLLQLNRLTQILGVCSLVLVALYPLAKRVTWWPQLMLGFTFGYGAPMGATAAGGHISLAVLTLYAAAILWVLGFDTIYGFQDIEDDALAGIKSTSRRFAHAPKLFVGGCYALCLTALTGAAILAGLNPLFFIAALLPAAIMLAGQAVTLDPGDPGACLALFKSNREAGILVALAICAGRY